MSGTSGFLRAVTDLDIKRGDVFYADLNPVIGSEQGGVRPVLVVQNDIGNRYSPTTIVAAVTSRIKRAKLPTHVELPASRGTSLLIPLCSWNSCEQSTRVACCSMCALSMAIP